MVATVCNIAKGRITEFHKRVNDNDPANSALVVVLLKVTESHALLEDYDTLSALLAGSNTECDFTNYTRKILTDTDIGAPVINDTSDRVELDMDNVVWTAGGGAVNNTVYTIVVCYDDNTSSGTDANIIPMAVYDANILVPGTGVTTNGSDLTWVIDAPGYARAE